MSSFSSLSCITAGFRNNKNKMHGLDRFRGNGPYGKIPTKIEPIRTLGVTLPYNSDFYIMPIITRKLASTLINSGLWPRTRRRRRTEKKKELP